MSCVMFVDIHQKVVIITWVMGGLGGPGAMKATVEAVALLATTGSLICCSTLEMFLRDLTVHTPCNIIMVILMLH